MPPLGYVTSYAPRLRQYANSLISPVLPTAPVAPPVRTTKRGTVVVNYAENDYDDDDFEDSEGPRRPTGLRSLRRDEITPYLGPAGEKLGKEISTPVNVQANYRDWVVRKSIKAGYAIFQSSRPFLVLIDEFIALTFDCTGGRDI